MDDFADASGYADLLSGVENHAELQTAFRENRTRVMQPGDRVADWSESGLDMDAVLAAAPGGVTDNVYRRDRADDLVFDSSSQFGDLFGADYQIYLVIGDAESFTAFQGDPSFGLIRVGDGLWLETLSASSAIGNARCLGSGAEAVRLHTRRPYDSLTKLEKSTLAAYTAAARYDKINVCSVGEAVGNNRYRSRYFLPDGRRLPVFDGRSGRLSIVPRADVRQAIVGSL